MCDIEKVEDLDKYEDKGEREDIRFVLISFIDPPFSSIKRVKSLDGYGQENKLSLPPYMYTKNWLII